MGTIILILIIIILWAVLSALAYMEVAPATKKLNEDDATLVRILFMICGPAFAITTIANEILDSVLPEGWDDDEGNNFINKY
jgi:hypothetical protein